MLQLKTSRSRLRVLMSGASHIFQLADDVGVHFVLEIYNKSLGELGIDAMRFL
jgi:hypothetical protein